MMTGAADAFGDLMQQEAVRWKKVIRSAGIKPGLRSAIPRKMGH